MWCFKFRIPAGSENLGWRKAAEAWASASSQQTQRNGQSDGRRHDEERRRTPVTRDTDQIIIEGIEKVSPLLDVDFEELKLSNWN